MQEVKCDTSPGHLQHVDVGLLNIITESKALSECVCVYVRVCMCVSVCVFSKKGGAVRVESHRVWNMHHVPDKDQISYVRADTHIHTLTKKTPKKTLSSKNIFTQSNLSERDSVWAFVSINAADMMKKNKKVD